MIGIVLCQGFGVQEDRGRLAERDPVLPSIGCIFGRIPDELVPHVIRLPMPVDATPSALRPQPLLLRHLPEAVRAAGGALAEEFLVAFETGEG